MGDKHTLDGEEGTRGNGTTWLVVKHGTPIVIIR